MDLSMEITDTLSVKRLFVLVISPSPRQTMCKQQLDLDGGHRRSKDCS